MMSATPATCHQTEMLLRIAIRWPLKMLRTAATARMITKMMKTRVRL